MPLIAKHFLRLFFLLTATVSAFAQSNLSPLACDGSVGDPLVHIDFGSGAGFGPALPAGTTTLLGYQPLTCPTDGGYNIMSSTPACWNADWHAVTSDNTGNPNGYYMMVNAALPPSDFYISTVSGLCADTDYQVSFAILNIHKYGILPNITVIIETLGGSQLASYNTGPVPLTATPTWSTYSMTANIGLNTSVRIRLRNNAPGGVGNDLCLDDIIFRPIGPSVSLSITGFPGVVANITTDDSVEFTSVVGPCYTTNAYQWQVSTDNGANWNDIPGATSGTYLRPPSPVGIYLYRLLVSPLANGGNPSCEVSSGIITVNVTAAPCASPPTITATQSCTAGATITVTTPLGANFLYSINGTAYQSSPIFNNPAPGTYNVTYKDTSTNCVSPANQVTIGNNVAPPPPVVTTPVYYCQGDTASPLSATALPGNTLRWYGTNATGGTASSTAPTPLTATVGTVTYYVSQFNGTCESTRASINVIVSTLAPNTAPLVVFCDTANHTPTSVAFDWNNVPGYHGYNYVYTVAGGPPVYGFIHSPSHINIPVPQPGTSVTFTILEVVGVPCMPSASATCHSTCATNVTPTFSAIPAICQGTAPPTLPTISNNGISGTWSPSTINTSTVGTTQYEFTPDPVLFPCANDYQVNIQISAPSVVPTFSFPNSLQICNGGTVPTLPNTSNNGITGTWNQSAVSNTTSGTYIFTPTAGQCAATFTLTVQVNPLQTLQFNNLSASLSFCQGSTPPVLSTTSNNTIPITGSWSPATINTSAPGTTTYTFTANGGQCVVSPIYSMSVTINASQVPTFAAIPDFCEGTPPPSLPATSLEGIPGTWTPAAISNQSGTRSYQFQPAAGQCASSASLSVTVIDRTTPIFPPIASFCAGSTAPVLPSASDNVPPISGVWSPATVSNTATANYTFIPDANQCADEVTIQITVDPPQSPGFSNIEYCDNQSAPVLPSISPNGYAGAWSPTAVDPLAITSAYTFTPDAGECATAQTIQVTQHASAPIVPTWTTSAYFHSGTVTINANSPGTFLYQLDNGPIQESNVFTNVAGGLHSFTVYDLYGCAPPSTWVDVINLVQYPHFFTPNADGHNDTWNIFDLRIEQPDAPIFIFDRYGKLICQIRPQGSGWDGTYNGHPLPSTDYWFLVKYLENGAEREFKSHFSLKR